MFLNFVFQEIHNCSVEGYKLVSESCAGYVAAQDDRMDGGVYWDKNIKREGYGWRINKIVVLIQTLINQRSCFESQ